jgi:hypothetical protein
MPQTAEAGSHLMPANCHSVSRGNILVRSVSKYGDAVTHSIKTWNANGRRIRIAQTANILVATVRVSDYYSETDPDAGNYECSGGDDEIYLNERFLGDPRSNPQSGTRRAIVAHEFGHALNLGDHDNSRWYCNALMYSVGAACPGVKDPLTHDLTDYRRRWGPTGKAADVTSGNILNTCKADPELETEETCWPEGETHEEYYDDRPVGEYIDPQRPTGWVPTPGDDTAERAVHDAAAFEVCVEIRERPDCVPTGH